jgi:hypothetical protein
MEIAKHHIKIMTKMEKKIVVEEREASMVTVQRKKGAFLVSETLNFQDCGSNPR